MTTPTPTPARSFQIMPQLTDEEFSALKESIRHNGVLEPLVYDQDNRLIDGHHRLKAFKELILEGVDLPMYDRINRTFDSDEQRWAHVIAHNFNRRHLTPEQRAEIIVTLRKMPFGYTMPKIAETLHVSIKTISVTLASVDEATKQELANLEITGADGKMRTGTYAPRIFQTGTAQLRDAQMHIVRAFEAAHSTYTGNTVPQAPIPGLLPNIVPLFARDAGGDTQAGASVQPVQAGTNGAAGAMLPQGMYQTEIDTLQSTPDESLPDEALSSIPWYGGKYSHLKWLLPLLLPARCYVEPFAGSGAVLLNRPISPIEIYNDLDKNVVNFFKVLRNQTEDLIRELQITPYSREERRQALQDRGDEKLSELERARQFFVLARQTRAGQAQVEDLNSWRMTWNAINRGLPATVSQWHSGIAGLARVAARLTRVQIECYPALKIIDLYDAPDGSTFFYLDPPYMHETRRGGHKSNSYAHEMTDDQHAELAARLHTIHGKAAISGYPSELYEELYADWHRFDMPTTATAGGGSEFNAGRIECLWTNYPLT